MKATRKRGKRNYEIKDYSLDHYIMENKVKEIFYNTSNVLTFILGSAQKNYRSRSITKTQLDKQAGLFIQRYGSTAQKENLHTFRHGPYLIDFDNTLMDLENNGIIATTESGEYRITSKGIVWLDEILRIFGRHPKFLEIQEFVSDNLFKKVRELSKNIYEEADDLIYKSKDIGEYNLKLIFDWSTYANGIPESYHYVLLYSYGRMEPYFKGLHGDFLKHSLVSYDEIPDMISFSSLPKPKKKFEYDAPPLHKIFQKEFPKYLNTNKFESKNYIHNLWYIIEGVNIIHIFENICPGLDDLAILCLLNYRYAWEEKEEKEKEGEKEDRRKELKEMRDRMIKNDVYKLHDWHILKKMKWKNHVRFQLSAKNFYDEAYERTFSVLSPDIVRKLYYKRIKPFL